MRFVSLLFQAAGLAALYAFASGAPEALGAGGGWQFLSRMWAPFESLSPLACSVLAAGCFLVAAGLLLGWRPVTDRPAGGWAGILLAAFTVNAFLVAGSVLAVFLVSNGSAGRDMVIGAVFAAATAEAALGTILAAALLFMRRPMLVYVPSLAIFFAGVVGLGALFFTGNAALP